MGVSYHLIIKDPETKKAIVLRDVGDQYGREIEKYNWQYDQFMEDMERVDDLTEQLEEIQAKKLSDVTIGDFYFLLTNAKKFVDILATFAGICWVKLIRALFLVRGDLDSYPENEYENRVKQQLIEQGYKVIELF